MPLATVEPTSFPAVESARRILIVDDDRDFSNGLADILSGRNCECVCADDLSSALRQLRESMFEIALVDIRLGAESGIDVVREVVSNSMATTCIMMTAHAAVETAIEALRLGAYDYLKKPLKIEELFAVLDRCFKLNELRAAKQRAETALEKRNRELGEINARLRQIFESTTRLTSAQRLPQIGTALLEEFGRNLRATGGSLYFVENDNLRLVHALDPGHAPSDLSIRPDSDSPFAFALREKHPLLFPKETGPPLSPSGWSGYKGDSALIVPIIDRNGEPLGVLGLHDRIPDTFNDQDIEIARILASFGCGAIHLAETVQDLQQSEERYRTLVETMNEGVAILDQDDRIVYANDSLCRMTGFSREDLVGKPLTAIAPDENAPKSPDQLSRRREGKNRPYEIEFPRKTGESIFAIFSPAPILDAEGNFKGSFAVVTDITERKRAERALIKSEEKLRQMQKMEAIGRLAGGVAHDFNNLLTAILGYSDMALDVLDPSGPAYADVEEIKKAGQRASSLTQQLLAFSRKQMLQPQVLNLNLLVADMNRMLHRLIGEHIEFITDFDPNLKPIVFDPSQAQQIVMNLVINARDAMPEGGRLKIVTKNVDIAEADARVKEEIKPGPYALLSFTDTGSGMDEETMARVFEPFFTTKEQGKGTGLGLSTVFGILRQSGGDIQVTSSPSSGTTFNLYLPQGSALQRVETSDEAALLPQGSLENILLVEDEGAVRRLAARALKKYGYRVVSVEGALAALKLIESGSPDSRFDLLLTDIVMPEMSGKVLVDRVRKIKPDIRILYMSGYDDKMIAEQGTIDPTVALLQKPFRIADLVGKVRAVLDETNPPG